MEFKNLRVKDIYSVMSFQSKNAKWIHNSKTACHLQVMIHGKAIHDFGDRKLTITDNCIYFLNKNEEHRVEIFKCGEAISSMSINFSTYEPIETPSFCIKLNNISEIINLFEKIRIHKSISSKGDIMALSYFYRLCSIYESAREKEYSPKDRRITDAADYIDLNFSSKSCLDDAADLSKVSRRRFNELFKKQLGITPNKYLTSKRIGYARQLLNDGVISLSEIAESCGFSDIYYFSKVFKAETGVSPNKYRHNNL